MTTTVPAHESDATTPPPFPGTRSEVRPLDPPPELQRLVGAGCPMARVRLADGRTPLLVTSFEDQRHLLADKRISADVRHSAHPNHDPDTSRPMSFITMDDPHHRTLRKMVTAPFTVRRVAEMRPAIQTVVDEAIDAMLAGGSSADLMADFALPVPSSVISQMLGVPASDHAFFQEKSAALVSRTSTVDDRNEAHRALIDYLGGLVATKRRHPGVDMLTDLVEKVDAQEITTGEVAEMGLLLLLAGHETTANMIALGTVALLENPDQLALLRDGDDALAASAVEELLRYLTITHNGRSRVALEDIEIGDVSVRAGEGLVMATDIGNRDPQVFDDPDRLDITRDARRHIAFGFGPHQCLGQPLARLELQIVYSTLYRRIPTLELDCALGDLPFKHDAAIYGVHALPVRW